MPIKGVGLIPKFNVSRVDGKDRPGGPKAHALYFVLDIRHDKFARHAAEAYATACAGEYPELAHDLRMALVKTED